MRPLFLERCLHRRHRAPAHAGPSGAQRARGLLPVSCPVQLPEPGPDVREEPAEPGRHPRLACTLSAATSTKRDSDGFSCRAKSHTTANSTLSGGPVGTMILFGRRPPITVAWDNAPGLAPRMHVLAEGLIHAGGCDTLNMAFGQNVSCRLRFLGLRPRLRRRWPSAKETSRDVACANRGGVGKCDWMIGTHVIRNPVWCSKPLAIRWRGRGGA